MKEKYCFRILIVDDDEDVLEHHQRVLLQTGNCIETAASGEEALNQIRIIEYDLVLLDLSLTLHKSGLERVLAVKPPCEARR